MFSSVHAIDAVSSLYRLLDMGIEPFLITSAIVGVVAQRLVRRICVHCTKEYTPTIAELAFVEQLGGDTNQAFLRGTGCRYCSDTGYFDRVGVYEVLRVSDEVRQLIVAGASPRDVREVAGKEGLSRLRSEALRLVQDGVTPIDEVIRNVYVAEGTQ